MHTRSRRAPRASGLFLAVSAALSCAPVPAATAPDPVTLDAIVVTDSAPRAALTWQTDPRLPRQPVPASDGADYLKTIPGFAALRNGGSNGDPVLRGMSGSRLNLLGNDGAMPGACPGRMDNPTSYVAPETFDRLVVVKGPQTVRWGPGASAGTVRFEREAPRFDRAEVRMRGSVLAGSSGRRDQVAELAAGAARGHARLAATRSRADDYRDGDGRRVPSAWDKWNADLALAWTPDAATLVELDIGAGDGRARYAGRGMDGTMFRRDSRTLKLEHGGLPGVWNTLRASAYDNRVDHLMDNYHLRRPNPHGAMPMAMASNVGRHTRGGRVEAEASGGDWELFVGVDGQDSRHRGRSAAGEGAYLHQPWTGDARLGHAGLFAEGSWMPQPRARWVAGLRLDRARAEDRRLRLGSGMMARPNPTAGQIRHQTLPGGFLRYEHALAGTPLDLYAGLGHARRMPDYWELFSPDHGPAGAANAFAGIRPERTTQLDVGLAYRAARLEAWLSAYAGRVDDFILFTYRDGGMMGTTTEAGNMDVRTHGAEAGLRWQPHPQWTLGGSLAWAHGDNRTHGRPLAQIPPLESRWSLAWDNGRWSAGALLRMVAAQDRVAVGQGNVAGRDLGPSAGFATLALNAGMRLDARWTLAVGVDNVFDRAYSEHLNLAGSADFGWPADPVRINEPGRAAWLKLTLDY